MPAGFVFFQYLALNTFQSGLLTGKYHLWIWPYSLHSGVNSLVRFTRMRGGQYAECALGWRRVKGCCCIICDRAFGLNIASRTCFDIHIYVLVLCSYLSFILSFRSARIARQMSGSRNYFLSASSMKLHCADLYSFEGLVEVMWPRVVLITLVYEGFLILYT